MNRSRALTAAVLAGALLAAPMGAAVAEDGPGADPSASTPSPGSTGTETSTGDDSSPSPEAGAGGSAEPSATPSTGPSAAPQGRAVDNPPVAQPDTARVRADGTVRIPVLANDDNGEGVLGAPGGLSVTRVTAGAGATGRFSHNGTTVLFTPQPTDRGTFAGSYVVRDASGQTATGQMTVQVEAAPARSVSIALANTPVALRKYQIAGDVRPTSAGRATVTVQRRTPSGWVRHAVTTSNAQGRYTVGFTTNKLGTVTFRARAAFEDGRTALSPALTRSVVARADARVSGPLSRSAVRHSWRSGCPVPPSQLRKLSINRLDYQGRISRGVLVLSAGAVGDMTRVFTAALDQRFPIRVMKPSEAFYAGGKRTPIQSDKAAMRAGNTSAFNCRPVVGNPYRVSQHSYGNAIDINTIENPYVVGSTVYPAGSRSYLDRSSYRRGMILRSGVVASRMRAIGWLWGARWSNPDYQHFSSNGG